MTPDEMRKLARHGERADGPPWDQWLMLAELCERLDRIAKALEEQK